MNENIKKQIDDMSYESMLRLWRHAPSGHPMFQGETGEYFSKIMKKKRENISNSEHVQTSKNIGW